MKGIILIVVLIIIILVILITFTKNKTPVYKKLLKLAVKKRGRLRTDDLHSAGDIKESKKILDRMYKDGALTLNVCDNSNIEYIFSSVPFKYDPVQIFNLNDFFENLQLMASEDEDGQIFLSEIIFAFDMDYDDIICGLETFYGDERLKKEISRSGNVYLMFEKNRMDKTNGSW
ncbi:MAG: hypothetical protein R6V47_07850 [Candidatus Delongbacteria bacterium]